MENQNITNTKNILNNDLLNINDNNQQKPGLNLLDIFNKNKIYLIIVVVIIISACLLYYLYLKKKEKNQNNDLKKNMLEVVDPKNDTKLLYNNVDKQYYKLDGSGNPLKTTIDLYQRQHNQEQYDLQEHQQQMHQQEQQQYQQPPQQQQPPHQQQPPQNMKQNNTRRQLPQKLKHVSENVSDSIETSESLQYDITQLDDNANISQFNLNSEDINEINVKLSED